jgi:hypothetical protein
MANILDTPLLRHAKPWWHPFVALFITLYGILALGWSLQPIVFLFWWELILMAGAALIRGLFALDGASFWHNLLPRLAGTAGAMLMFGAMIMLAITFSFKAIGVGMQSEGLEKLPLQINLLVAGYLVELLLHYFGNGRFRIARPMEEVMQTLVHFLVLLALLMVLAMHLIPAYPQLNQSLWVGIAVVVVKFVVDFTFVRVRQKL